MPLLEIRDLRTYYYTSEGAVQAVDGINLDICEGEIVGLVGESGCGKSTVGLSIMRLIQEPGRIVNGRITFKGTDLLSLDEERIREIRGKEIAMIFQDPMTYLNPVMTVGDQIAEVFSAHSERTKKQAGEQVRHLLELVSAPGITKYYPHELSGGLRQRVLTSMALAGNPSLLIADEPTTALDVTVQAQILELIGEIVRKMKLSMLIITHNLGIVADICDRVNVMYAGKIAEMGFLNDIFYDAKHPYTRGLLESARSIQLLGKELVTIPGEPPNLINPPSGCRFQPRCPYSTEICNKEPTASLGKNRHQWFCWNTGSVKNESPTSS